MSRQCHTCACSIQYFAQITLCLVLISTRASAVTVYCRQCQRGFEASGLQYLLCKYYPERCSSCRGIGTDAPPATVPNPSSRHNTRSVAKAKYRQNDDDKTYFDSSSDDHWESEQPPTKRRKKRRKRRGKRKTKTGPKGGSSRRNRRSAQNISSEAEDNTSAATGSKKHHTKSRSSKSMKSDCDCKDLPSVIWKRRNTEFCCETHICSGMTAAFKNHWKALEQNKSNEISPNFEDFKIIGYKYYQVPLDEMNDEAFNQKSKKQLCYEFSKVLLGRWTWYLQTVFADGQTDQATMGHQEAILKAFVCWQACGGKPKLFDLRYDLNHRSSVRELCVNYSERGFFNGFTLVAMKKIINAFRKFPLERMLHIQAANMEKKCRAAKARSPIAEPPIAGIWSMSTQDTLSDTGSTTQPAVTTSSTSSIMSNDPPCDLLPPLPQESGKTESAPSSEAGPPSVATESASSYNGESPPVYGLSADAPVFVPGAQAPWTTQSRQCHDIQRPIGQVQHSDPHSSDDGTVSVFSDTPSDL